MNTRKQYKIIVLNLIIIFFGMFILLASLFYQNAQNEKDVIIKQYANLIYNTVIQYGSAEKILKNNTAIKYINVYKNGEVLYSNRNKIQAYRYSKIIEYFNSCEENCEQFYNYQFEYVHPAHKSKVTKKYRAYMGIYDEGTIILVFSIDNYINKIISDIYYIFFIIVFGLMISLFSVYYLYMKPRKFLTSLVNHNEHNIGLI